MLGHHHLCRLSISAGIAMAIAYSLGALLVVYAPDRLLQLAAPLHYMTTLQQFALGVQLNWMSYLSGVAQTFFYTAGVVFLTGLLCHCMHKDKKDCCR